METFETIVHLTRSAIEKGPPMGGATTICISATVAGDEILCEAKRMFTRTRNRQEIF